MGTYEIDEATFALDERMQDISGNSLEAELPDGGIMRIYVVRRPKEDGTLAVQVRARLADLRRQLPGYEAGAEVEVEVDGRAALESRFSYRDGTAELYQRTVGFFVDKKLVMLGIVAPTAAIDLANSTFENAIRTLEIDDKSELH